MAEKNRPLYILRYLLDNTDEDHPATIKDICAYLESKGIKPNRKTVASDLVDLQDSGFDVVCNRSRQNKYFIGSRTLETAELKTIIDAVRAAKFISPTKSRSLIEKLSSLASPFQAKELQGEPFADGTAKTTNEGVYYTVDLLHYAINHEKTVEFQYSGYTADKEKVLKHGGAPIASAPVEVKPKKPFELPARNDNMRRVYAYLLTKRGLDRDVVYAFARKQMIYESAKYHNAVFVGFDREGNPRHANMRGTGSESSFKGNADSSEPEYSFHWNGKSQYLCLFEAPIDMLSFIPSYYSENRILVHPYRTINARH